MRFRKYTAGGTAVLLGACLITAPAWPAFAEETAAAFTVDQGALPFAALPAAQAHWGVLGDAGYRLEVPHAWNGELVIYAHGFRGEEMLFVDNPRQREHLIANGYAWAASSFSTNEYAVVTAADDSNALLDHVAATIGAPSSVYAVGDSMGGHIAKYMVEEWPETYAGALAACSGDVDLFDYYQDVYLIGETLVGNTPEVPVNELYSILGLPSLHAKLGDDFPTILNEVGAVYKDSVEMLSGGERPIYDEAFSSPFGIIAPQLIAMAGGGLDNSGTTYQLDTDLAITEEEAAFNASIMRIAGEAPHRTAAGWEPAPGLLAPDLTGDLAVPVMSLHTLGDLFVPFSMQQLYAKKAEANNASDLLVTRAIRDVNHCGFTTEELTAAFDDLAAWAKTGNRPEGDEVLDPAVVAAPSYGCAFTTGDTGTRGTLPTCPDGGTDPDPEPAPGPGPGDEPGADPEPQPSPGDEPQVPKLTVEFPARTAGAIQAVTASGFTPGEVVTGMMHSKPLSLGTQIANAAGEVSFS